jgi:23S rRNA (uracil1939-C5)-methyltransferase
MSEPFDADLEIERVVAGGDGLARHDSLVVFVPRTLAGERVRARVEMRGRLARGTLARVERASPARIDPPCPHYTLDACGGCQVQHATYAEQLAMKSAMVSEAFRRIAKLDVLRPDVRPSASEWRYRRKLTLAMRRNGEEWMAGLRRHDDPDAVFDLRDCPITDERVVAIWRKIMHASEHFPSANELRGAVRMVSDTTASFTLEGGRAWPAAERLLHDVPRLRTIWWVPENGPRRKVASRTEEATPDASFVQINAGTAEELRAHVVERVAAYAPMHVVDAYAGDGDTAVALSQRGSRVTAIEADRDAARYAADRLTAPSRSVAARVEDALRESLPADVVLLNPPRTGVHERVCRTLEHADARAIIYVSCDPATLARDVARLPAWRVASLICFDMFPQTAHVETVCELVPARAA